MAFDRATYQREYMREYMRKRRAAERQATPPPTPKAPTLKQAVEAVFLHVRANPGVSADAAARELGLNAEMLKDAISGLKETGKLYVHTSNTSRQYLYIED